MKIVTLLFLCLVMFMSVPSALMAQTYMGTQLCQGCHSNSAVGGIQYTQWSQTLHSKIHLTPDTVSIRPVAGFTNRDSVSMGASYGNAKVYLRRSGNDFYATVGLGGTEYKIAWTYGWGFKQRYLVKIDTSYYILPIQYNLAKYLDNATYSISNWASYTPSTWFNSDGSVKSINNTFRTKSWDKNCIGCHVTGGKVDKVVSGADTSWHSTWANNSTKENIVVGCEACHGPYQGGGGAGHQMNPSKLTTKNQKIEICGQCHNRASSNNGLGTAGTHEFNKNEVANTYFNPADTAHPLSEFMNFATAPNTTGGPGTWPDLVTARQHHQQYQEFLGSKHFTNSLVEIVCFTCHTAHSNSPNGHSLVDSINVHISGNTYQKFMVDNDNNTLCLSCHATSGPFAAIPKLWVTDPVAYHDSIGAVVNQHTKHNLYDPNDALTTSGSGRCTKCHMAKIATTARAYDIHTHTYAVVPPIRTLQNSSTVIAGVRGMVNSCAASCHRNPAGGSAIPDFGIGTDPTKTDWGEATDLALADTLWRYWQAWGFTGVKEVPNYVPIAYSLSQNYPNPFNPSTKINVDVARRGDVRLKVYNIIGEVVATLMDGSYEAGRYEVTWRGRGDDGMQSASGVYLYKLEVGSFTQTKKMIMMK